jgi:hypothetical protein
MKQSAKNKFEIKLNPTLNTLWIDTLNINVRSDENCLLRFMSGLPEGIFEQTRIMTSRKNLEGFINVLCESLDYYPTKTPSEKGQ